MTILGTDVSKAVDIHLGNFPDKWRIQAPGQLISSGLGVFMSLQQAQPHYPEALSRHYGSLPTFSQQHSMSSNPEQPVLIHDTDINPTLCSLMQDYIKHFWIMKHRLLCKTSNINEGDLPTEPKYMRDRKIYCATPTFWVSAMVNTVGRSMQVMPQPITFPTPLLKD